MLHKGVRTARAVGGVPLRTARGAHGVRITATPPLGAISRFRGLEPSVHQGGGVVWAVRGSIRSRMVVDVWRSA